MKLQHSRQFFGALCGFLVLVAATLFAPAAAMANGGGSSGSDEISAMSDEEFIDHAMSEGEYEVGGDGSIVIYDTRSQSSAAATKSSIAPSCIACAEGKWKIKSTSGPKRTYGSWNTQASGWGPGTLSRDVTVTQSNGYSGSLAVSKSVINASVGFDISWSNSTTNTYSGELKSGKQGFLQVRNAYDRYSVKQEYIKLGKTTKTTWVYPKEYAFTDHRIKY